MEDTDTAHLKMGGPGKDEGGRRKATSPSHSLVPALFLSSPNVNFSVYEMKRLLWGTREMVPVKHLLKCLVLNMSLTTTGVPCPPSPASWNLGTCPYGLLKWRLLSDSPRVTEEGAGSQSAGPVQHCRLPLTTGMMGAG